MERRAPYATDTQHVVNLSGYVWATRQLDGLERFRVLDVACGTGYGSDYLGGRARVVVGIDRQPAVVARCRAEYRNARVAFLAMDVTSMGFRDGSFDAVVSQDTIEHIVQDRLFVVEVTRVLRKGGILVLLTPHGKERGQKPENPEHVREYTPDELAELLSGHFASIRWFGRRQGARLRAVERRMDAVRRWDPLGLRRLLPRWVRHRIGSAVSVASGGVRLEDLVSRDVEYVDGVHDDTNLIAVCVK